MPDTATDLAPERCKLAYRVGCPAQARVPTLGKVCGGMVHSGYFCLYVRGAKAYPLDELEELHFHDCDGCRGDHRRRGGTDG